MLSTFSPAHCFSFSFCPHFRSERCHSFFWHGQPFKGWGYQAIQKCKWICPLYTTTNNTTTVVLYTHMVQLNVLLAPQSCCILAVTTRREQLFSESDWSQPSWRIKMLQILKRSKSLWPVETLSSRNWRLFISSGNTEQWRRGIMNLKNNYTHRLLQDIFMKWSTDCGDSEPTYSQK